MTSALTKVASLILALPSADAAVDWRARALALAEENGLLKAKLSMKQDERRVSGLQATVQVAQTDAAGAIVAPHGTTHVVLEIGCSDRNTLDEERLPHDRGAFLIAFEPMLDKYAVLLARGTARYGNGKTDVAVPLGHLHQRGVVLPFAVTARGGPVAFHVSQVAGCSSTSAVNNATSWGRWCTQGLEERQVPSISLAAAIGLAGAHPIELIKIDAQGIDASLVMATNAALLRRKVRYVQLETVAEDCNVLYEGQMRCLATVEHMRMVGFKLVRGETYGGPISATHAATCRSTTWYPPTRAICESDLVFAGPLVRKVPI